MNLTDPLLMISAIALVGIVFAMVASHLIATVTASIVAQLDDPDPDLSRIYRRGR